MSHEYWAACRIEDLASNVKSKFDDYRTWMEKSGYADRIRASYRRYYAIDHQGSLRVERDADDIARLDVNHFKSLLSRMHIMATENKLAYQPKARNSDTKSQVQSDIGRGLCEYYGDEKDMNGILSGSVLGSIIMLERWIHMPWDYNEGYELTVDDEKVVKDGDQKFEEYNAFDVAHGTSDDCPWRIIKTRRNKWDLARLNSKFYEEIVGSTIDRDPNDLNFVKGKMDNIAFDDDDYTYVYILYHARTASMEHGRWAEICAGNVLRDGPLRYSRIPLAQMRAGSVMDTIFSDSPAVDLLAQQECLNAIFSGWMTNGLNNALQLLYCADPNLITRKLDSGQTLVSASSPPTPLNLNAPNDGLSKIVDALLQNMQLISGVNDVARGNPSSNLKSGASLAVVLAQAIQYVSDLQKNYARCAGEVGTILINNVRMFGPEEFIGYVTGVARKGQVRKFKREDLMDVDRVTVDLGNPLTQNIAGRFELAELWTTKGIMKNPKQIVAFIRTGELDQTTENDFSDMLLIRDENEQIRRGEIPPVLLLDLHGEHILEHKAVMSSPEAREDDRIVEACLAHIQWHVKVMREVPPDLAAVLTGMPLPPPEALPPGGLVPEQNPNPTIDGASMPSMPPEAPIQAQQNYNEALDAMPQQQSTMN